MGGWGSGARGVDAVVRGLGGEIEVAVAALGGRGVDDGNGHTYRRVVGMCIEPALRSRHRALSARCIE